MPRKTGSRPINGLTPKRFRGGPCHIPAHVDRGGKSLRLISTGCCILCNRERLREVAKTEKGRAVSKDYITRRAALVRDLNQIAPSLEAHHQDCRKVLLGVQGLEYLGQVPNPDPPRPGGIHRWLM
jgi:hypothetical protein